MNTFIYCAQSPVANIQIQQPSIENCIRGELHEVPSVKLTISLTTGVDNEMQVCTALSENVTVSQITCINDSMVFFAS